MNRAEFELLGRQRVAFLSQFFQPDERAIDHGFALWLDIEPQVGRKQAEGFIVATQRRLLWSDGRRPSSLPFDQIASAKVRKRFGTADLIVELVDGQISKYLGEKMFFYGLVKMIEQSHVLPVSENGTATVGHDVEEATLVCSGCGYTLGGIVRYCTGCIRTFDWEGSKAAYEGFDPRLTEYFSSRTA